MAAGGESDVIVISSDSEDSDSTEISTDCDNILTFTPTKRYSTACHRDRSLITNLSFFYRPPSEVDSDEDDHDGELGDSHQTR